MRNVNIVALSEFMGHADIKTTMIYAHVSPEHKQSEINKLHYFINAPANNLFVINPYGEKKEIV